MSAAAAGRVLLIEDDETVRFAICDMLDLEGIPCLAAEEGSRGVALAREHGGAIGVVVLDLQMPGMSGEETFRALRALAPELPIVLSSGHEEAHALGGFEDESVAGYLKKPYPLSEMVALVRHLLG